MYIGNTTRNVANMADQPAGSTTAISVRSYGGEAGSRRAAGSRAPSPPPEGRSPPPEEVSRRGGRRGRVRRWAGRWSRRKIKPHPAPHPARPMGIEAREEQSISPTTRGRRLQRRRHPAPHPAPVDGDRGAGGGCSNRGALLLLSPSKKEAWRQGGSAAHTPLPAVGHEEKRGRQC
jgi:hypothetical protein